MKSITSWIGRIGVVAAMLVSTTTGIAVADPRFAPTQFWIFSTEVECEYFAQYWRYELYECREQPDVDGPVYELFVHEIG